VVIVLTRANTLPPEIADRLADFLSEGGLGPALRTLARRAAIAVELDVGSVVRLREPIEVAAYHVVSEALTNTTRHASASVVHIFGEGRDGSFHLSIRDDGVGGADPAAGSGLIGLRDRVEALGGSIAISSPPGEGTLILVELPLRSTDVRPMADAAKAEPDGNDQA
jgi:signal transduction histidine kinase